jgi:hypothetical protein
MRQRNVTWRLWAKALGEKGSNCNNEADKIAIIRTLIFVSYLVTNLFICAGVVRHWQKERPAEAGHELRTSVVWACKKHLDRQNG